MKINELEHEICVIDNKIALTAFKADQHIRDARKLDCLVNHLNDEQEYLITELKWRLFMISLHMTPKAFVSFATKYWAIL